MRLLTADFIEGWHNRMINIHPSLLPAFPGLDTHKRALAEGVKFAGCTVHYVRFETDTGPIIAQAAVPVLPDDTEELPRRPRAGGRAPALSPRATPDRRGPGANPWRAAPWSMAQRRRRAALLNPTD